MLPIPLTLLHTPRFNELDCTKLVSNLLTLSLYSSLHLSCNATRVGGCSNVSINAIINSIVNRGVMHSIGQAAFHGVVLRNQPPQGSGNRPGTVPPAANRTSTRGYDCACTSHTRLQICLDLL